MKRNLFPLLVVLVGWLGLGLAYSAPMGTTINYQGRLAINGSPANGKYDFQFRLYNDASLGSAIGPTLSAASVSVSDGQFGVFLDFGVGIFNGDARWLEIAVRASGVGALTVLTPRQPLMPSPYALYAPSAGTAASATAATTASTVAANGVTAAGIASGQVVKSLNGLRDTVQLVAGTNVTLATTGNTLKISASSAGELSANVARRDVPNNFTGNQIVNGGNVGIGTTPTEKLDVAGNIKYGGQLKKLDVADNFEATVRAADFKLGTVGRRGTPGRALVDFGDTLALNFASDWTNTTLGGHVTIDTDSRNAGAISPGLVFGGGSGEGIASKRTAGGNQYALNFFTAQQNRMTILNNGNVGIGTGTPQRKLDVNGVVRATAFEGECQIPLGQVVKSINGLTDQVTLSGGANITLTPNGKNLQINVESQAFRLNGSGPGSSGGKIVFGWPGEATCISEWEENGLYIMASKGLGLGPGNVGIHLANLAEAIFPLTVGGDVLVRPEVGFVQGRASSLFLGDVNNYIKSVYGQGLRLGVWQGVDALVVKNGGNIGIGTTDPQQKLHVVGLARFDLGEGSINISTPGGNPGLIAYAPNGHRRDIVMGNDGMRLLVGNSASPASAGIDILENGATRVKILQITGGADLAEPFETSEDKPVPKGAVMVIDEEHPGQLRLSDQAYDKRVAGVVSGAGGLNPGLTLSQQGLTDKGLPVALSGRVYTLADTSNGQIRPGDQLTTSGTPGHAMKVTDHASAQGAILGKAMSSLETGRGLVLVLVTLQ